MAELLVYTVLAVLLTYALYNAYSSHSSRQRLLSEIPTVGGPSGPLSSYLSAIRFLRNGPEIIREGYEKGSVFKVSDFDRWIVVVGPKLIDELKNAPDDVLSSSDAANDILSFDYTLHLDDAARLNDYHVPIVRTRLTRNLNSFFPVVHDEIVAAFADLVAPKGDEWVKLPALDTVKHIICRVSNRAIVGQPLCRNPEYGQIATDFTLDVVKSAILLRLVPKFLKPTVGSRLPLVPRTVARAANHLRPIIEERLHNMEEHGDNWLNKPNDLLQWLLEDAEGEERDVEHWTMRVLLVNFASIHTTSMAFTQALYDLAANPEYLQPMREEVAAAVNEDGWCRAALQKMRKVDSFLKESERFLGLGIGTFSLRRKVLKPYTFSDGTTVPVGVHVSAAVQCIHADEENYSDAEVFDGFRFAKLREEDGQSTKHQFVNTANNYLLFGRGRHACPGRFFAATELKTILAHLIMNYDVKLEGDGLRPRDDWIGGSRMPNRKAKVMFRKRQA
ncbi:cytochrome P450 [Heliocybe sulcata]|uniref:Cytochrome P450 n=1 Tax=Heliocybe sulcata TaxID=5364 RepID=A0A5C3MXC6_9AGAM|nr:cytochrome P450 [Heliocybe sulcata]